MEKIKNLIKLKDKPETTLSLVKAVREPKKTVSSYIFTNSIRDYFEQIFEEIARGRGRGFWVQAEFGAGKTHFIATLTCLLTNLHTDIWDDVNDTEIKNYRRRLQNVKLFPVVINLRGESGVEEGEEDDLFSVIEEKIADALQEKGFADKVILTTEDALIEWYKNTSQLQKEAVDSFIKKETSKSPQDLEKEILSKLIGEYCKQNSIRPKITANVKERIKHIYEQIVSLGYSGILFIIDEFAFWQDRHPEGTREFARDEDILETLAWSLPQDYDLNIYTIAASQQSAAIKERGDRFKTFLLLAGKSEKEYDIIVSRRVRELVEEKRPEIEQYFEQYHKKFDFLKEYGKRDFYEVFPFQPKTFEILRKITQRELPTARSGIFYIWEVMNNEPILSRDSLIPVGELLSSESLIQDLNTQTYRNSYQSYLEAIKQVKAINLEGEEIEAANRIIKTLFLWHAAYLDTPKHLSAKELTEMCLVESDLFKGPDLTEKVLVDLRDNVPQISYTKEKGAIFIAGERPTMPTKIFQEIKRKITDPTEIQEGWEKGLILSYEEAAGKKSLFNNFNFEEKKKIDVEYRGIIYPGEAVLIREWRSEYGEGTKEDSHFRIVILTKNTSMDVNDLKDSRIAICIPSQLTQSAIDATKNYLAFRKMDEKYKNGAGSEAEEIRTWLNNAKSEKIADLLSKQLSPYKSGKIITKSGIAIDEKAVFYTDELEKLLAKIVEPLLNNSYTSFPIDTKSFKKKFSKAEAKKVFEGFFKADSTQSAQSACEHFGLGLGLSKDTNLEKFNPEGNVVFEWFREKLKKDNEDVRLWKLYRDLESPPFGLTKELITLYLLSFVRLGNPSVEIRLKPQHKLSISSNRINSFNVPDIDWSPRIEDSFDSLVYSTERTWNDVLEFARIINPSLKTATAPEEIKEQNQQLIQPLKNIKDKIPQISENLNLLSQSFGENIDLGIIDKLNKISECEEYQGFYNNILKAYSKSVGDVAEDIGAYIPDFKKDSDRFDELRRLSEQSTLLIKMREYLSEAKNTDSNLSSQKNFIMEKLKLSSVLSDLSAIEDIKKKFEQFRSGYQNKYQIYHRDYKKEIGRLKEKREKLKSNVDAFSRLIKLDIGMQSLKNEYQEFLSSLKVCSNPDPVSVEAFPVCKECKATLGTEVPVKEAEELEKKINENLELVMNKLLQMLTPSIMDMDKKGRLKELVDAIKLKSYSKFCNTLTDDLVDYIKDLFEKANIVVLHIPILSEFARKKYAFVEEDNLEEVVDSFKKELKDAIEKAKKENPGKKIRIELR